MTPTWCELWQRIVWLAYHEYRAIRKGWRRRQAELRQAKRIAWKPWPQLGSPIMVSDVQVGAIAKTLGGTAGLGNSAWGGNQLYYECAMTQIRQAMVASQLQNAVASDGLYISGTTMGSISNAIGVNVTGSVGSVTGGPIS